MGGGDSMEDKAAVTPRARSPLGQLLWQERLRHGWTYERMAEITKVDASTLNRIVRGEVCPQGGTLERLAVALGYPAAALRRLAQPDLEREGVMLEEERARVVFETAQAPPTTREGIERTCERLSDPDPHVRCAVLTALWKSLLDGGRHLAVLIRAIALTLSSTDQDPGVQSRARLVAEKAAAEMGVPRPDRSAF